MVPQRLMQDLVIQPARKSNHQAMATTPYWRRAVHSVFKYGRVRIQWCHHRQLSLHKKCSKHAELGQVLTTNHDFHYDICGPFRVSLR